MDLAREILKDLRNIGLRACVAGGYVRDMVTGEKPKDIDVFIYGDHSDMNIEEFTPICEILDYATHLVKFGNLKIGSEYKDIEYPVDEIEHLIKGQYKGFTIDLIFWKKIVFNAEEVIDNFDMNINQGYITEDVIKKPDLTTLRLINLDRTSEERVLKGYNIVMRKLNRDRYYKLCTK